MNVIKSSWAISLVNVESKTNVSETSSGNGDRLVFKTLIFDSTLTWLIAQEDFITNK
jgi:hypothetical protein